MSKELTLHLISDATGQTLDSVARACMAQFPTLNVHLRQWNLVRTSLQLRHVLEQIAQHPGLVMSSFTDPKLQAELKTGCDRIDVKLLDVLHSAMDFLAEETGETPNGRPGGQYIMDESYNRRIRAMHYVLAHDDGQEAQNLNEADVILVGVSRVSKTPTCFYLANKGILAANVPLIMGIEPPASLFEVKCPVIGLTIDPQTLIDIRKTRLSQIIPDGHHTDRTAQNSYVDHEKVTEELAWARRLCRTHGWPIIDVTRRSIEETSASILELIPH
ncbi:kinase/pyrophosphorylase [Acetobacteraceae bacterium ESL0709]|nr:kinase/pyrophosphorylase [Acetobacteraceae bacterium ESL0697]MDF7677616.1 kinase/pyrophosphorylase [Acetobacteraceae bacterium ESL0709]